MKANFKAFVKERDEMLKKCSVEELRKFVNDHKKEYGPEYVERFNNAHALVQEITLHKMIVNVPKLPEEVRAFSAFWLGIHGCDLKIK